MDRYVEADLLEVVQSAVGQDGIVSAAIFIAGQDSSGPRLAAAAGIEGPALDRLVVAVRDAHHPIARSMAEEVPSFDVEPIAPGGPALRSHVPILGRDGRLMRVLGVLALAHAHPLDTDARRRLGALADRSAAIIDRSGGPRSDAPS